MAPSLDGRIFDLVSSTAGPVDAGSPTRFVYSEGDGLVWGEYSGDTVRRGRFVGERDGDRIRIRFGHVLDADGTVVTGEASSRIEVGPDGLRLVEEFEVGGRPQESVCVERRGDVGGRA